MIDTPDLAGIAVFGGLSPRELELVHELLEGRAYDAGAVVVEEGTSGRELFVIERGRGAVLKRDSAGRQAKVAELAEGDCFGEMALVGIMRRSATVRAETPLATVVFPYASIARLADEAPETFTLLLMNLARELCRRLAAADAIQAEFHLNALRHPAA